MKSRFFYGVFVGFVLACLFFFGVSKARAQASHQYEQQAYQERSWGDYSGHSIAYATDYAAYNYDGGELYRANIQHSYYDPSV